MQKTQKFSNNKTHHNSTVCFGWSCNLTHYCNENATMQQKKSDNETCNTSYQCLNGNCASNGKCSCTRCDFDSNGILDIFDVVAASEYLSGERNESKIYNLPCSCGDENLTLQDVFKCFAHMF